MGKHRSKGQVISVLRPLAFKRFIGEYLMSMTKTQSDIVREAIDLYQKKIEQESPQDLKNFAKAYDSHVAKHGKPKSWV